MKKELEVLYKDLLKKHTINNPAKLCIYTKEEYLKSSELKEEIKLTPHDKEELLNMPNITFGYLSTQSNTIYIFEDYYDNFDGSFKKLSKELLYIFTLVHEFRHMIQREETNSFLYYIRKMELVISNNMEVYNNDTHDSFYHEIDSNLYTACYLKNIINNYSGINYNYINLLYYVYQYDLCGYDFDLLIRNYIELLNNNKNINNILELFLNKDNSFKDLNEIISNKDNIDREFFNIIITSKEFIEYALNKNLNKNDKSFLIKEIKHRIQELEKIKLIDIGIINELLKRINIKINRDFNSIIEYRKSLINRLNNVLKLLDN